MKKSELTQERLKELLSYDPETGVFRWRIPRQGTQVGAIAGHLGRVYWRFMIEYRIYNAHRLAWLYAHGRWPAAEIDHINGVPSDNRLCNLREATREENGRNYKTPTTNTSGFKGVSYHRMARKWHSRIRSKGVLISLGYFDSAEAASAAYEKKAEEIFGEFRRIV